LDEYNKLPSKPHPIEKSAFNWPMGLKEFHMVKLAHGLKAHIILLRDQPMTGSNLHLLMMTEFYYNIKKQRVIKNKIMVFHRHLQ
jgi:hypothetical protein